MKRLQALILALVLCVGLTVPAFAAAPKSQTKTVTLDDAFIYSKVGPVKVTVTYTGWLGEIDMPDGVDERESDWTSVFTGAPKRKVQVIQAGSEVRFTVRASDPSAYYNIGYEKGEFDMYTYDDSGGGCSYWYDSQDASFFERPFFVLPVGDGTAQYKGGYGGVRATGKKTGASSFAITVDEGLMTLAFNGKTPGVENWDNYGNFKARYLLGTVLAVTKEQEADLAAGKTPTFHKGQDWCGYLLEYQYDYPGLMELFGQKTPDKEPLEIWFDERTVSGLDNGLSYHYTITNNTDETITGYYALLSYEPEDDRYWMGAQFHLLDIDIPAGKTVSGTLVSGMKNLSRIKMCWLEFDSKAERDSFFADSAFYDEGGYYNVYPSKTHNVAWLESKLGVSLER